MDNYIERGQRKAILSVDNYIERGQRKAILSVDNYIERGQRKAILSMDNYIERGQRKAQGNIEHGQHKAIEHVYKNCGVFNAVCFNYNLSDQQISTLMH